jgi:antitoxin YefM
MKAPMSVMGYSAVRQQLAKVLDAVVDDRQPVVITRSKAPSVVLVALDEYEAMAETLHLLRSPANARRLQKATADAAARRFVRSPRG